MAVTIALGMPVMLRSARAMIMTMGCESLVNQDSGTDSDDPYHHVHGND
jgi:hypothetical protein